MSNTRKIISLVLAVVMALSIFSICATAAGETATWTVEVTNTDGSALTAPVPVGGHVKVTVKLQSNFYVGVVGLPVYYSDAFSFVSGSAVLTEIYGAGATRTSTNDDYTAPTGYKAFYALYVPNSGASGVAAPMYSTATTILTFELEAVTAGTADVYLDAAKQKTASNPSGVFYVGYHADASVTSTENIVETFAVPAATTVTIGASDPVLTGINGGYVDDANGYVYGVPQNTAVADFTNYFSVENGTFDVSANGTGATLTVYTTGGTVFASYTLVIFGDVNGDGAVTLADKGAIGRALTGAGLSGAQAVAADVNGDGTAAAPNVTLADTGFISRALTGSGMNVVNPWA